MSQLPQAVQSAIADWLRSGEIEVFIGYEPGPMGLKATPAFVRRPEDVGRLIWDPTCETNLAAYLPKYKGMKVGLMVKGCDARAVVGLTQEKQVTRENLRLVGVSCPGVVDPKRVAAALGVEVEDLDEARVEGEQVVVGEMSVPLAEAIYAFCRTCPSHAPVDADVRMVETVDDAVSEDPFAQVREMEALSADERWERFSGELRRCVLCYACREACPLCYCNICFVDRTAPRWTHQTARPSDVQFFQIMRTFHLAGRCVGCGACTRACPQGVNLRLLLDKLRLEVQDLYGYEAGVDAEARPPLATYSEDDYNGFVL